MTREKQYKQELVDELKQKIKGKMRYADILLSVATIEMIIKALEQEPILDKIIAEMEELIEWHDCPIELDGGNDAWYCEAVKQCMAIIDKYRQEG